MSKTQKLLKPQIYIMCIELKKLICQTTQIHRNK